VASCRVKSAEGRCYTQRVSLERRPRCRPLLPCRLDQLDVLLEQLIDELSDLDAAGLGALGEVGPHLGVEVHRQVQRGAGLEKLAAGTVSGLSPCKLHARSARCERC
jgi:hypothetical protein